MRNLVLNLKNPVLHRPSWIPSSINSIPNRRPPSTISFCQRDAHTDIPSPKIMGVSKDELVSTLTSKLSPSHLIVDFNLLSEETLPVFSKFQLSSTRNHRGVQLFLQWAMMQGVAMLLQNRYQRQRLYTRIALGKAKRMDVVWGETAGVDGQLWLLYPILFTLQGFEAYVGLLLLQTAFVGVVPEWQVTFCGLLLVIMAVGNFANTVQTLMAKSRFKAKMKRSKSKQELN